MSVYVRIIDIDTKSFSEIIIDYFLLTENSEKITYPKYLKMALKKCLNERKKM